jgi:uncharacterized protein (DUF433 family)
MDPLITTNPKIMHGTLCFAGTRVAVQTFFDHLKAGYTIEGFLEQFPTVGREQVELLLEAGEQPAMSPPQSGADLVSYWQQAGLIGTRPDIADATAHARSIRRSAERRR